MKEPIDNDKVDAFVSSLWNAERSLAHRVYAAYFIRTYSDEIKNYIDTRYSQSGANLDTITWAKKTRKLLARYKKGPNGYAYNPTNGSLESLYAEPLKTFRLSTRANSSLTFDSSRTLVRLTGYIVASVGVIVILSLGYMSMQAINKLGESWIERLNQAGEY